METFGLPMSYEVIEWPASRPTHSFNPIHRNPHVVSPWRPIDGPAVSIEVINSYGNRWVGEFESGFGGVTTVVATPSLDAVCVVSDGYAYYVDTLDPHKCVIVPSFPVKHVRRIPGRDILLFVDLDHLTAFGPKGLLWETSQVSWDGIELIDLSSTSIRGKGWNAAEHRDVEFVVDCDTGTTQGGANRDHYR